MQDQYYKQEIPDLELAIERATDNVPPDRKYYVLRHGVIVDSFPNLKKAQALFRQIVEESGYKPEPPKTQMNRDQAAIQHFLESKELYWADSHRHRSGGGRGGRGGV